MVRRKLIFFEGKYVCLFGFGACQYIWLGPQFHYRGGEGKTKGKAGKCQKRVVPVIQLVRRINMMPDDPLM